MNAMAMFYDPKVSYKNDLIIFSFMNFHENFINLNEKMEKIKPANLKNGVYLGNQKPLHAENGMN